MAELEPLEPSEIRHVVEPGLDRENADGAVHGHFDYYFGEEPTALWARAYVNSMDTVAIHGLEAHDVNSDHVMRVLMYLRERFANVEAFDVGSDGGHRPLRPRVKARLEALMEETENDVGEGTGGWDTPEPREEAE
jgi:hypothetical protein